MNMKESLKVRLGELGTKYLAGSLDISLKGAIEPN